MKISIKLQFMIFFSVCISVAICLASGFFYYYFNQEVTDRSFQDLNKTFSGYATDVDILFEKIQKFNDYLNADEIIIDAANRESDDLIEQLAAVNRMKSEYNKLAYLLFDGYSQNVTSRFFISEALPVAKNIPPFEGMELFKRDGSVIYRDFETEAAARQGGADGLQSMEVMSAGKMSGSVIFSQPVYDCVSYSGKLIGRHFVQLDMERLLYEYTRESNYTVYTSVLLPNGNMVYSDLAMRQGEPTEMLRQHETAKNEVGFVQLKRDGRRLAMNVYPLKYDMKLLVWVDLKEVSLKTKELGTVIFLIAFLTLLPVLFIMSIMLGRLTRPIRELSDIMRDFNMDADMSGQTIHAGSIEVQQLYECFSQLIKKIQRLITDAHIRGEREKEMEMQLLYAQVSPHYLYNALDSITWMALSRNEDDIADMISALAEGFRYSIKEIEKPITIQEEINFLIGYLHLQELRHKGRFNFKLDVDKETEGFYIPKFILQPLIENSIIHGMGSRERTISIILSVVKQNDTIIISIADNGTGFDPERLNQYLAGDSSVFATEKVGIKNVYERIRMKCGEGFGLQYKRDGDYLVVEIRLPVAKQQDNEEEGT